MAKRSGQPPNHTKLAIVLSVVFLVLTLLTGVLASFLHESFGFGAPSSESEPALPVGNRVEDPFASGQSPSSDASEGEPPPEAEGESSSEDSESEAPPASDPDGENPASSSGDAEPQPSEPEDGAQSSSAAGEEEKPAEPEPVFFNVPSEMRAVMVSAGRDYLTDPAAGRAAVASQIDKAISDAKGLTMNTILIDTKYNDQVLFSSSALQMAQIDLDCTDYLVSRAREQGFYVYATYDVTDLVGPDGAYRRASDADGATLDDVKTNLGEFVKKYQLDGVLLKNYYNESSPASYAQYLKSGGGLGYQNYQRQVPEALLAAAVSAVRENAPGTQVGLMADAVWENAAQDSDGSATESAFTALGSGNTDTRKLVLDGLFDFVMVMDFGSTIEKAAPFAVVAQWWSTLCADAGKPLYVMHASDRVGTQSPGWTVYEQLTKQVIDLEKISGVSGNAFNSLKALLANPGNSTTTLVQYMNDQVNEQWVLTQLAVTAPAQLTFTTKEQTVTFQGASDPQAEVTLNGEKIPTNESGYFTINEPLKAGMNTFTIAHKGKSLTYNITRQVQVLKSVSPTGSVTVDGGMEVTVTALAYEDATVTASIGGQNITLIRTDNDTDDANRESGYRLFTGVFTAPSASASATQMGNIMFTATAQGETQTMQGAAVTVNKKAVMGEGAVVYVVSEQAETFPIDTLNDNSHPGYYPIPKGTIDKTFGDEIVYKNGDVTKSYWKLESGMRVYSPDIKATNSALPDQNKINDMKVKSSGAYTTVSLATEQKVPYKTTYDGNKLVFQFAYTASAPESQTLKNNALFTSADWNGSNLTLNLKKAGGFLGYRAYYDGNDLVLRFNNSPGSLSGARVVVDPGHGGNDPGALGFYPGKDEADINLSVANKLASELKSKGATVLMVTPGSTMASRMASARAFNPQVLVSVHCNSVKNNSKASGSEVYYFFPFQKQLATNVSANVAASLGTTNRGAKQGLYYMTRESQFACILAELGFVTNEDEYTKLINSKYQNRVAEGIANGVSGFLGGTNSGGGTSGGDEEEEDPPSDEEDDSDGDSEDAYSVTKITVESDDGDEIEVGDEITLYATVKPSDADDSRVKWTTSDSDIVALSDKTDDSCLVEGLKKGTATITATARDGSGVKGKLKIKVSGSGGSDNGSGSKGVLVDSITIDGPDSVSVGTRVEVTGESSPSDAKDGGIKWSSSDSSIATVTQVDDYTCKVEGIEKGSCYIIGTAYDDGGAEERMKITVT